MKSRKRVSERMISPVSERNRTRVSDKIGIRISGVGFTMRGGKTGKKVFRVSGSRFFDFPFFGFRGWVSRLRGWCLWRLCRA